MCFPGTNLDWKCIFCWGGRRRIYFLYCFQIICHILYIKNWDVNGSWLIFVRPEGTSPASYRLGENSDSVIPTGGATAGRFDCLVGLCAHLLWWGEEEEASAWLKNQTFLLWIQPTHTWLHVSYRVCVCVCVVCVIACVSGCLLPVRLGVFVNEMIYRRREERENKKQPTRVSCCCRFTFIPNEDKTHESRSRFFFFTALLVQLRIMENR